MIAEIHCMPSPAGDAGAPYRYIEAAIAVVERSGLNHEVGALGTTFEGPPDRVWTVLRDAHEACLAAGAEAEMTHVRIFQRTGAREEPSMADLVGPFRP